MPFILLRPTQARNSGRAEHCWIAGRGWMPRRGASCRQLGRGGASLPFFEERFRLLTRIRKDERDAQSTDEGAKT